MSEIQPIPGPRGLPFLGNLLDLAGEEVPILGLERLADIYGPIYQLTIKGKRLLVCSSVELVDELIDEKRFQKQPPPALTQRPGPKGLFAAANGSSDWEQAHRILIQPMGPLSIEEMFDDMKDVANQLVLKWARKGPSDQILATDDFTRLTLDTIALCAMAYRFNSFYSSEMHPFVGAMLNILQENGARTSRPGFVTALRYRANEQFKQDAQLLKSTGRKIIDERRSHPTDKKDLLNAMLYGVDPKTGECMRDELIVEQMSTFLIAGHETTSGLLSFTFYYLLKNSSAYLKARKEVDEVIGKDSIQPTHLKKLKYLNACLRESIRLAPTAPAFSKQIHPQLVGQTVLLGGKYKIEPDDRLLCLLTKSQKDPKAYGDDAAEFKPERMEDEEFDKLPSGAWKPFGNGVRACIGRPFAWQEALMVTAMILQNFDLTLDDPSYTLRLKQTLTIKPKDMYIRATLRKGIDATLLDQRIHSSETGKKHSHVPNEVAESQKSLSSNAAEPLLILFGSNTGTCQAFAQRLASDAATRGFRPEVMDMDSAVQKLPKGTPVVIITPSYEGQPPDNAARFIEWLQSCETGALEGVNFVVFGCGHKDWARTFHRIPRLADALMAEFGGHRIAPLGLTDVSKGNIFGDFEDWVDDTLWPNLVSKAASTSHETAVDVEISTNARASSLRYDVSLATVKENKILTAPGEPQKWHMEVQLPSDTAYECGDYLAVLPLNSEKSVQRVMAHFKLPWDAVLTLRTSGPSTIPTNVPLSVYDVLRSYVELAQPATKKNLKTCMQYTDSTTDKAYLEQLAADTARFNTEVLAKRTSVFDILTTLTSIALPFAEFLSLLPPLRVRQYSISSSPLHDSTSATITYAVIDQPALADPAAAFQGVAGTYLATLKKGDAVQVSVKATSKKTFRLPVDVETTPILMLCAGTGLAPFRGFMQQRAVLRNANTERNLAKAVIYVGCRSETKDRLYAEELDEWIKQGVVEVRYAFSRESEKSAGCKYVAERMAEDAEFVRSLWADGARVYVCGSREFEKSVGGAARRMAVEQRREKAGGDLDGIAEAEVDEWFKSVASERIASDVFD